MKNIFCLPSLNRITAFAPATTDGYVKAMAGNIMLVTRYPKMNFGNLYHKTLGLLLFAIAFCLYNSTLLQTNC